MQFATLHTFLFLRLRRQWLYALLAGLICNSVSVYTAHALDLAAVNLTGKITIRNEKLTTNITGASLWQVMAEISKVSGVQVRWLNSGGDELVSVNFVALPLSEAMSRLLGERNFMLFYSSTGAGTQLTHIWISSRRTGKKQLEGNRQPLSQKLSSPAPSDDDIAEENFVSPDMLLQTVLYDHDSTARLEAIARLAEHAPKDPRITNALSHLADNDADAQVRGAAAAVLETIEEGPDIKAQNDY